MDYLSQMIELEERVRKWEAKDQNIASYIKQDSKRRTDWLAEGEKISSDVFNSTLSSEDKSNLFSRIKSSYSSLDSKSENVLFNYQFGLGILTGIFLSYIFNSALNSISSSLEKGVIDGLQARERNNLRTDSE